MIGDRIKLAREALGLSMDQLGKTVGVNRATVSRWESGFSKPRGKLPKIAKALKKPVEWFQPEEPPSNDEILDKINRLENTVKELKATKGPNGDEFQKVISLLPDAGLATLYACLYLLTGESKDLLKVHKAVQREVSLLRKLLQPLRQEKFSRE